MSHGYLSPGKYSARAIASGVGTSSAKGTPYVTVTFATDAGEVTWTAYVTDKTQDRVAKDLQTLGYQGDDPEDLTNRGEEEAAQMLPNQVTITVEDEEFNGQVRSRVKWIDSASRPAAAGSLFASMKASFHANKQAGGAAPAKPATKPAPLARPAPPAFAGSDADDSPPF